jgi:phenylacetate-CoA ligase
MTVEGATMETEFKFRSGNLVDAAAARLSQRDWLNSLSALALKVGGTMIGRGFLSALNKMQRAQWLSPEELQKSAEERLARLLRHAAEDVPFYREFYRRSGLAVDDLRTIDDLSLLPIVGKAFYREHGQPAFYAESLPAYRRLERTTSGSTGEPFRFCLDRAALPVIFASHLFYDSWYGLRPFDRYVRIVAPPAVASELPPGTPPLFRLRQAVTSRLQQFYEKQTQRKIWIWEIDDAQAKEAWSLIEDFQTDFVMGYTSALAALAEEWRRRGLSFRRRVRGVVTIAETLTQARRSAIEQFFQVPIINRYGMRELGSWSAQNCLASPNHFHINTELVICEVVRPDGSPCAPGETGRVVLTDLLNYVQPFIRYETGDLAVAAAGRCACGRGFPLLGEIEGRSVECFRTPSGREISPVVLGHYLFVYHKYLEAVSQYQLVQESASEARLLIVPTQKWDKQQRGRLQADMARLLGSEIKLIVEAVPQIPPEKSGKRPIIKFVSERPPDQKGLCRKDLQIASTCWS